MSNQFELSVSDYVADDGTHMWGIYVDGELFYFSPYLERCLKTLRLLSSGPVNRYAALWDAAETITKDIGGLDTITVFAALVKLEDLPCMRD